MLQVKVHEEINYNNKKCYRTQNLKDLQVDIACIKIEKSFFRGN